MTSGSVTMTVVAHEVLISLGVGVRITHNIIFLQRRYLLCSVHLYLIDCQSKRRFQFNNIRFDQVAAICFSNSVNLSIMGSGISWGSVLERWFHTYSGELALRHCPAHSHPSTKSRKGVLLRCQQSNELTRRFWGRLYAACSWSLSLWVGEISPTPWRGY